MKYYIIAGEASGDLHGSNLIRELIKKDPVANIRCWGGPLMQSAGATLVKDYKDLAFMGFAEVIKNLPTILRNLKFCKSDIQSFAPDAIVLIDYPGFNLRIAEWAKARGYTVIYYISPQVWAWKESRVKTIKSSVDKMMVILPFEKDFYAKWNYPVEYVGHPLVKVINDFMDDKADFETLPKNNNKPIIALLPGSRQQEILKKLPLMLAAAEQFPGYSFIVAKAPGIEDSFYSGLLKGHTNVTAVVGKTYDLLYNAKAALVTSGTATLETALFGVPQVICYKGNPISYSIARRLVKIKYIGLVNLIMDKPVVKELIQHELTTANIVQELEKILHNAGEKLRIQNDYSELKKLLGAGGDASARAASIVYDTVSKLQQKST